MQNVLPIVLITPEAQAALEAEAERAGATGDVIGGLLFGYSLDERRRLVIGSVRPRQEIGFGEKEFSLEQSRTSQQLAQARKLDPKAHYCGVWYIHRTPTGELTDEEWVQAQGVLEDPDYRFDDVVCLVVCLYSGRLNIYALSFNRYHSTRGQLPSPTVLRLTTEAASDTDSSAQRVARRFDPKNWYKAPEAVKRLEEEHRELQKKYRVESAVSPDGKVVFRLMPRKENQDMVFYLACESGFPERPPAAFLVVRGDHYPLLSPALSDWTVERRMHEMADDLVHWQVALLDQQIESAKAALGQGEYKKASDLLAMVLLINPRMPGVAHLLAQAEAGMGETPVQ